MEAQRRLAACYAASYPAEVARRLETVPSTEVAEFLADVEPATAIEVIEGMMPSSAAAAFEFMDHGDLSPILELLPVARCVLVFRAVDQLGRKAMIDLLPMDTARKVERLLKSSQGSAGVLAEPVPVVLSPEMEIREASQLLEGTSGSYAYVVDPDHRLVGVIHRRDLSRSEDKARIANLMSRQIVRLPSAASLSAVRSHRAWSDFESLPVVDGGGVLVGVIRHRSVRRTAFARGPSATPSHRAALEAFLELGEVYWSGLTSVLGALGGRDAGAQVTEVKGDR
jgi:magnesium transporter